MKIKIKATEKAKEVEEKLKIKRRKTEDINPNKTRYQDTLN